MDFTKTITASSGGSADSPSKEKLPVTKGIMYYKEIYFPPGSSGLLHVRVTHGGFPIFPSSIGETLIGDNIAFSYDDLYMVETEPFSFTVVYYNLDEQWDHLFRVSFGVVSKEIYQARFLPTLQADAFERVYEKILSRQREAQLTGGWGGFSGIGKER